MYKPRQGGRTELWLFPLAVDPQIPLPAHSYVADPIVWIQTPNGHPNGHPTHTPLGHPIGHPKKIPGKPGILKVRV